MMQIYMALLFVNVLDFNFEPRVIQTENTIVLENQLLRRVIEKEEDVWRTTSFSRSDGSDEFRIYSDEFMIRLMDGTELTIKDYRAQGKPMIQIDEGVRKVTMTYEPARILPPNAPLSLRVEYDIDQYLHKRITIYMPEGGAIDQLDVERFQTGQQCDLGGFGQPIFIGDSWFVGLEYPGCQTNFGNGLVTLSHFPGLVKNRDEQGKWVIESKKSIVGTGQKGDPLELAFQDYIDTLRVRRGNLLHYNSWYDLQGNELTHDNLINSFMGFKENLLGPFGLTMDSYVPDDGWQEPDSIWDIHKTRFPDGFTPLRDLLEQNGSRLGIWMPFNGFNLNIDWGVAQGYQKSDKGRYYCLADPKYNVAIHEAVRRIIKAGNMNYIKHDFNQLQCSAEGHGHLPTDRHGFEANLDAELELLAYERSLQPGIFLNVTSYVWHSPWWLQHADTIWMAADDFGYEKTWPQVSPREWAMSYRDAHMFKVYQERRHLVPISDMMTCGIIHGPHCKLGGDEETLREWSDYVVMFFGRGVQLQEYYITPDWLTPERWNVLGETTRWAVENRKLLEKVIMVGGDTRKGEPYAYVHWKDEKGLLFLRNPDLREQTIAAPFDKTVHYCGDIGKPYRARVIYPFVENCPTQYMSGNPISITVPGCSVMVIELHPGEVAAIEPTAQPEPISYSSELQTEQAMPCLRVKISLPNENMQRCDLVLILSSEEEVEFPETKMLDVHINGEAVNTRLGFDKKWFIQSVNLQSWQGQEIELIAAPNEQQKNLFQAHNISYKAWLVMDRAVQSTPPGDEHLPFAIAQDFRRMTMEITPH
ncbi:MAG: hypothetical protein C4527_10700 [Candidatus Omnitrophota bacterium]|jgi:hypothetical protein|nr:MAG: hypothetical protein C4527_10700 [Candidatus Omnitrophota bacterium]